MEDPESYNPYPVLTDAEFLELERVGTVIHRTPGSLLFGEGEETDFALVIRKGTVRIAKGGSGRVISLRGAGQPVGEQAAIRKKPRSASVYAIDDVEALLLSAPAWRQFLYSNSRAAVALLALSYDRQDESDRKLVESSSLAVEQRLARQLIDLVDDKGLGERSGDGIALKPFSQVDLAQLIGASRDAVVPVIRALKKSGIVATGWKQIIIVDPVALRGIARGERIASG
jgi:CRP/FNR family transcriptional regulator, cyclic AMP receptor protein